MATVRDRRAEQEFEATDESIDAILAELDEPVDVEHPDVSICNEHEWCLGAFPSGLLIWENVESGRPRHMRNVSRGDVRRLWVALMNGDLATIEAEPWQPGYGTSGAPT